jgi:GT2 family glycosyltransferase
MDIQPLVSIIIVNFDGKHHLIKCLDSLKKINYPKVEIILVDNNSSDGSIDFVSNNYPNIKILKLQENKGFAEPNNIGSKSANGDFLLFLNNDTIVTPNFISEMITVLNNDPTIAISQSLLLHPNGEIDSSGDFMDSLGIVYNSKKLVDNTREIFSARGASMMIRKKIFEKLDGFDEKFFVSFEDIDLGWRSWILGYKSVMIPKSIVYHLGGMTYKKFQKELAFHGFKNQLAMKITNFETPLSTKVLFLFFIKYGMRELKIWFDYVLHGYTHTTATDYEKNIAQKPSFKIIFKSIFWILTNINYLHSKYTKIQSTRTYSTKKLVDLKLISTDNL